jgi:hypothetical protein
VTTRAKGKSAILADRQEIGRVECFGLFLRLLAHLCFGLVLEVGLGIGAVDEFESVGFLVTLGTSRTVAPRTGAVDCVFVRLEFRLVLECDITLDHVFGQTNL